jgi:hypothetical protein
MFNSAWMLLKLERYSTSAAAGLVLGWGENSAMRYAIYIGDHQFVKLVLLPPQTFVATV